MQQAQCGVTCAQLSLSRVYMLFCRDAPSCGVCACVLLRLLCPPSPSTHSPHTPPLLLLSSSPPLLLSSLPTLLSPLLSMRLPSPAPSHCCVSYESAL